MNEPLFFDGLLVAWFVVAAATAAVLFFIPAPYGRHARRGWGPTLDYRLGWLVMEAPAALTFAAFFAIGNQCQSPTAWVFLGMWELHYVYRGLIYPFRLCNTHKRMPLAIPAMGLAFNSVNGYLNGRFLFTLSGGYAVEWLADPRFLGGLAVFLAGLIINRQSDAILRRLRPCGEPDYFIPYGGLYRWISCPNYLGEIVEWFGWALATWSWPGLAFAVWTAANLAPRALSHHRWYRRHLAGYPPERKALVPGLF